MTGTTVFDLFTGQPRKLNDLARRKADLTSFVCPDDGGAAPPFDGGGLPPPPPPSEACASPPPDGGAPPSDGSVPTTDGGGFCADVTCQISTDCFNTEQCLQMHEKSPQGCFECGLAAGCFDPTVTGGTCETVFGQVAACGASTPETQICLRAMSDIFASHCASGMQLTPCLCGTTPPDACQNGTAPPTGPLFPHYSCDLNTRSMGVIVDNLVDPSLGVGRAARIVECLQQSACDCTF